MVQDWATAALYWTLKMAVTSHVSNTDVHQHPSFSNHVNHGNAWGTAQTLRLCFCPVASSVKFQKTHKEETEWDNFWSLLH